ncbi:MAG: murein L,D-transpeptidase catalytic domain family protein [Bacteriovorax sp.]|jgi:hypothetical protein
MKQLHNSGMSAFFLPTILFTLMLISIFATSAAHASGAQLPSVSDGTEITDTTGTAADTGNSTTTPPPISDDYSHLDPDNIVPKSRLAKALKYFDDNKSKIKNQEVIGVIDFSQHSSKERFYVIDMRSGRVETFQTAHGKGSDEDHDGYATRFSNESGSNASSRGIYIAAETYEGAHGYSLKLDGKSSTNSNARSRAIVIHPADYVVAGQKSGRSWGCPALDPRESVYVINLLKNGAVIYAE